ncbi:MAG: hypothetical protein DRH97_01725 [Chloroflexi bacterium]|nr:MAG: hypothetical protein DRH97_01725 [Chloroflexota bacterium]
MSVTLTDDNSYVALDDANTYFNERLNVQSWDEAEDDDKKRALIMATTALDNLNFAGSKTDADQTLQFPRYDDASIPTEIEQATYESALALLDGVDIEFEKETMNLTEQRIGGVKVGYDSIVPAEHIIAGIPSYKAWLLLKPFLLSPDDIELFRI